MNEIQGQTPVGSPRSVARARQVKEGGLLVCRDCYDCLEFSPIVPFESKRVEIPKDKPLETCFLCEGGSRVVLFKITEPAKTP